MRKRTKWLAVLLAGTMLMGPTTAFAAEDTKAQDTSHSESSDSVFPFTLVTKDDQEVTFTHVPERVISTNPNTGEELMALGLGDKIIGTCYNNAQVSEQKNMNPNQRFPMIMDTRPWKSYWILTRISSTEEALHSVIKIVQLQHMIH